MKYRFKCVGDKYGYDNIGELIRDYIEANLHTDFENVRIRIQNGDSGWTFLYDREHPYDSLGEFMRYGLEENLNYSLDTVIKVYLLK